MHPPSRTRRILKWTGVGLSLSMIAGWILSTLGSFGGTCSPTLAVDVGFGAIFIVRAHGNVRLVSIAQMAWMYDRGYPHLGLLPPRVYFGNSVGLVIPFWLLLLLTAIPTAWLWHRDRRKIRPGCCLRCGYDLTGNTSGVCSECGLPKPPPAIG